jgi:outer membrane lipopolysaccharide assembly protein LptE/RlpB
MKRLRLILALAATVLTLAGCGIYSFSGTSIQSDVQSICIEPVVNNAQKINPSLANQLTEELNDKFRKLTKLEQVQEDGDLDLLVTIESYDVRPAAITADEVAAMNRLQVTVKVVFVNNKHTEDNINGQSFAAFEDYDSNNSLDMVEAQLCETIVKKLAEDIFNATVAQW